MNKTFASKTVTASVFIFVAVIFVFPLHYSFAETSPSLPPISQDNSALIKQLQALIISLQTQINELKAKLEATQKDVEVVKSEIQFTKSLARGTEGDEVKQLQKVLSKDPEIYPEGKVTGFFGVATEAAVKRFQEKYGIESLGSIGPKTRQKLNELITQGAGKSGVVPPGLERRFGTTTSAQTPPSSTPSGTIPAQPIGQTGTTTIPAIPATSTTTTASTTIPTPSPTPPSSFVPPASTSPIPSPSPSSATSTIVTPPSVSISGEVQISNNPAVDYYYPVISGSKVVYMDWNNGDGSIYLYDLDTGTGRKIASGLYPSISGNRIVYQYNGIHLYDLTSNTDRVITSSFSSQPVISGNRIVYSKSVNGSWTKFLYDITTNTDRQLSGDYYGSIDGNTIVSAEPGPKLRMYDLSANTERVVTLSSGIQVSKPFISNGKIVMYNRMNVTSPDGFDIYLYDFATNIERKLSSRQGPDAYKGPRISGDNVVWGTNDIYLYNLTTGIETQLTNYSSQEEAAFIDGNRIVWDGNKNGKHAIYLYTIPVTSSSSVSPSSSPTPSPSPSPTSSASTTDITVPSTPTNLTATPVYNWHVTLTWSKPTDNTGIVGYKVYRNNTQLFSAATSSSLSTLTYRDWNVTAGTSYSYTVAAYDAAGNVSSQSSPVLVTPVAEVISSPSPSSTPTPTPSPQVPPPVPSGYPPTRSYPLFGNLNHSVISISALLYPDPNGDTVKGVFDWGDGTTSEGTAEGKSLSDPKLITPASGGTYVSAEHSYSAIGIYSIKVKAVDATNLSSVWTLSESVTIGIAPNQPALTVTASGSNVILNWTESSTDVTGFKLYDLPSSGGWRLPDVGGSVRTYTDPGRSPGTYEYYIQAYNLSGGGTTRIYSDISTPIWVTVTTSTTTAQQPSRDSLLASLSTLLASLQAALGFLTR